MLDDQTKLVEQGRHDAVTTKKVHIRFFITLFLRNKKFIINKQKN